MSIEQQPEAWIVINKDTGYRTQVSYFPDLYNKDMFEVIPLYTHPNREPLSDEKIKMKWNRLPTNTKDPIIRFARAIEKAHGIGEG
jgi:hypothetical protein